MFCGLGLQFCCFCLLWFLLLCLLFVYFDLGFLFLGALRLLHFWFVGFGSLFVVYMLVLPLGFLCFGCFVFVDFGCLVGLVIYIVLFCICGCLV